MVPKFRVWLKDEKEMQNVLAFDTRGHSFLGIEGPHVTVDGWCDNFEVGKQAVIMQSTGLKDKNGVEIFEGDVLLHTSSSVNYSDTYWHSYVQAYRIENGAFRIKGKHIYDTDLMSARRRIEVVGNIYQHQKLLEKEYFSTSDGVVVQANEN